MSFFQNPFADEFRNNWLLGDRHHAPTFVIPGNAGRGKEIIYTWNKGPYNLSGTDSDGNQTKYLNVNYCLHNPKNWATIQVDLTAEAASSSAVSVSEVAASLLANTLFAERFKVEYDFNLKIVKISQKKPITEFLFYVSNGQAEEVLRFNARAGVAEAPAFFGRHTIANRFTYSDSEGKLILLDPSSNVNAAVIDNAADARGTSLGYDHSVVQTDAQLLRGKSGIFNYQKLTVDGSDRITQIIEYPAGALAGDMARKINYTYTSTNKNPTTIKEIPYTLQSGDLI